MHEAPAAPDPALAAQARRLAREALAQAEDARPHGDRPGEARMSLAMLAPLAAATLDGDAQAVRRLAPGILDALEDGIHRVGGFLSAQDDPRAFRRPVEACDGRGHARPVYGALFTQVVNRALALLGPPVGPEDPPERAELPCRAIELFAHARLGMWWGARDGDPARAPWLALQEIGWHRLLAGVETEPLAHAFDHLLPEGPLHQQGLEVTPDVWVYRELTTLHALDAIARGPYANTRLTGRVRSACRYHTHHTQPDYTTYQPWALGAFLRVPEARVLAEQQLHDVAAHLAIEGPAGAAVPALLLAEALD